jgi:beta-1,4-mannosyl-glycoprotein beta-1,4-N-acetylglucosaminyltransferase
MKVYNCFQFYNELDILEIRLQEGWDTTDYFVITESSHTHAGNSKNYLLLDNWERFKPYADKIRRIQVDETVEEQSKIFPGNTPEWVREKYQRHALIKGLHDLTIDDLIIISDADEIPRSAMIEMIKHDENDYDRYILNVPHFHFRLNYLRIVPNIVHADIMVVRARAFTSPMQEREFTFPWFQNPPNTVYIDHGGWHFSDFGNDEHVINKLRNFCHLDVNNPEYINNINIENFINKKIGRERNEEVFEYVKIDDYFPKCIKDNLDRWNSMIIPNAQFTVEDFYK